MVTKLLAGPHAPLKCACPSSHPKVGSIALSLSLGWPFDLLRPTEEGVMSLHVQSYALSTL